MHHDDTQFNDGFVDAKFQLLAQLGRGASGVVFKARHLTLDQIVAVKVIDPSLLSSSNSLKRFQKEAALLGSFSHPNIVKFLSFGALADGRQYMVLEYLEGESLADLIKREGALPQQRALPLFLDIAEALSYAHSKGVVHRDVKPGNVIIQNTEGNERAKLLDFGVYKIAEDVSAALTQTGFLVGSADYMSPEQCRGEQVDALADIYSLGCLMYETMVGRAPFHADSPLAIMANHLNENVLSVSARHTMATKLESIILKCLNKNKTERIQSAQELIQQLQSVTGSRGTRRRKQSLNWVLPAIICLVAVFACALMFRQQKSIEVINSKLLKKNTSTGNAFPHDDDPYVAAGLLDNWLSSAVNRATPEDELVDAIVELCTWNVHLLKAGIPPYARPIEETLKKTCARMLPNKQSTASYKCRAVKRYTQLALLQCINNEQEDSRKSLERAKEIATLDSECTAYLKSGYLNIFDYYLQQGNYVAAEEVLNRALLMPLHFGSFEAWAKIPELYRKQGRTELEVRTQLLLAVDKLEMLLKRDGSVNDNDIAKMLYALVDLGCAERVIQLFDKYHLENLGSDSFGIIDLEHCKCRALTSLKTYPAAEAGLRSVRQRLLSLDADRALAIEYSYVYCLNQQHKAIFPRVKAYFLDLQKRSVQHYLYAISTFQASADGFKLSANHEYRKMAVNAANMYKLEQPFYSANILYYEGIFEANEHKYREALELFREAEKRIKGDESYSAYQLRYEILSNVMCYAAALKDFDTVERAHEKVKALKRHCPHLDYSCENTYASAISSTKLQKAISIRKNLLDSLEGIPLKNAHFYAAAAAKLAENQILAGNYNDADETATKALKNVLHYRADTIDDIKVLLHQLIIASNKLGKIKMLEEYKKGKWLNRINGYICHHVKEMNGPPRLSLSR